MLERTKCDTSSEQVGNSELGIIVDAADAINPGIIHVDSKGDPATGRDGNNNAGGWAGYGDTNGTPKILANGSSDGQAGIVAVHELQVGRPPAAYAGSTVAGIEPDPTPGVDRVAEADRRQVQLLAESQITNLHSTAVQYAERHDAAARHLPLRAARRLDDAQQPQRARPPRRRSPTAGRLRGGTQQQLRQRHRCHLQSARCRSP